MSAVDHHASALSENDSDEESATASTFYQQKVLKQRTMSTAPGMSSGMSKMEIHKVTRFRRSSHGGCGLELVSLTTDEKLVKPRKFLIDVQETQKRILEQEDTDGDFQITINDAGPKVLTLGSANSNGLKKYELRGTYMLSNLLQELALANDYGRKHIVLDEARLNENPVDRLSRMIKYNFWDGLTRCIDGDGLEIISTDPKNRSKNTAPRIYIPFDQSETYEYYKRVADSKPHLHLDVQYLPAEITPEWVESVNDRPGLLALAMKKTDTGLEGVPFVVPGGRFNEMYGWDSYFESLGLIVDDRVDLAQAMVENFVYEINHYGKILNANRSYYLCRSQPPFLTDMALQVYRAKHLSKEWLAAAFRSAIKEYFTVWMVPPRLDHETGLSRFYPDGIGVPPETEASHFTHILEPYARAHKMSVEEFTKAYNKQQISEPSLDEYFIHDRAVRESGHDTSYRLENRCAHLATIDLNSLLYKYEVDISETIRDILTDLSYNGEKQSAAVWAERAATRKRNIDKYLWNENKSTYFDYDTNTHQQSVYESITAIYALWAGVASEKQAKKFVKHALPKFEVIGGLVSGTEESRGIIALDRPNRQWDYPSGWAPHQMLAWQGLQNYGFTEVAARCAYRWLFTITKSFVDFNGVVPEKFDVVNLTHNVTAEYGNQGVDFKLLNREGFGWMNASYQVGLRYITSHMRRALGTCTSPEVLFSKLRPRRGSVLARRSSRS